MKRPKRQEAAAHQQQPEIAGDDRAPLGIAECEQEADVHQRHREHRRIEDQAAEKLAEHNLKVGQRRCQQQLNRA